MLPRPARALDPGGIPQTRGDGAEAKAHPFPLAAPPNPVRSACRRRRGGALRHGAGACAVIGVGEADYDLATVDGLLDWLGGGSAESYPAPAASTAAPPEAEAVLDVWLCIVDGVHVGVGSAEPDSCEPEIAAVLTQDNQPMIPGSSLKGVFRSRAEYICRVLGHPACDRGDCGECIPCGLFGWAPAPGAAGSGARARIAVGDTCIGQARFQVRHHVALDRVTGGARPKLLYARRVAASRNRPDGQVLPVEALRARVEAMLGAHYSCSRDGEVGAALPVLIRDLHTSIAAGRDVAQLLDLAVLLHAGATTGWLRVAGAPIELRELAAELAGRAAEDRDTPEARGLAVWGGLHVMVTAGAADLARTELDAVSVATGSLESMQLAGMLALSHSLIAAVNRSPGDIDASLEYAAELAQRTGEGNAYWMGFGPTNVGFWRMSAALESGDHERVVAIAAKLHPEVHPFRGCQAMYWVHYGRALARTRRHREDAVLAFRRAELISPHRVLRDPITREVLAELLPRTRRDSPAGRELRAMAYRAGLPV